MDRIDTRIETEALNGELALQSQWMRRLVRGLVRDAAAADDVVQEAQLAALRRERSGGRVERGWLARVAANFARRQGRDEAVRRGYERDAARAEALAGADELAARLDAQRALADELRALAEPYRSTLVRRFFDGWSAARIAREAGCPATTVRTRIDRGLELLRERLDRRHGGRRAWLEVLAPLALPQLPPWLDLPSAPIARLVQGALLMKSGLQVAASLAVVTVVGVAWWWSEAAPSPAQPSAIEAAAARATPDLERDEAEPAGSSAALARRDVVESPPAATSKPVEPVAAPARVSLEARVVDAHRLPIASARAELDGAWGDYAATADGGGRLSFELPANEADAQASLRVQAPGFATTFVDVALRAGEPVKLGDVVLERGGAVWGRVERSDGRPVSGARVIAAGPDLPWELEAAKRAGPTHTARATSTHSQSDGSFLLVDVAPGGVRLWAEAPEMRFAVSEPLIVRADETLQGVVLQMEDLRVEDEIHGVVLAPDGSPAAYASLGVTTRHGSARSTRSEALGADGAFKLRVRHAVDHELVARDPQQRWPEVQLQNVAPGARDVVLRFEEARWTRVKARARGGERIERFALRLVDDAGGHGVGRAESDASGEARVRAPGKAFSIECAAPGFAITRRGPFDPRSAPSELAFELEPCEGLTGRVLEGSTARAGARVTLWRARAADESVEVSGYPSLRRPEVVDEMVTGDDGAFFLRVRDAAEHFVRAEVEGWPAAELGPLAAAPGEARAGLDLLLVAGGRIEGRVLVAPGVSDEGVIVVANRGDAHPHTVRTGAGGRFEFDGLTPGEWSVTRGRTEVSGDPLANWAMSDGGAAPDFEPTCYVAPGETQRVEIDLRDDEPARIRGRLQVDGAAAAGWVVRAWPGDKNMYTGELPSTALDERGEFTLVVDDPGPCRLAFALEGAAADNTSMSAVVELRRGDNPWSASVRTTRVEGRSARQSSDGYALHVRVRGDGVSALRPIRTDADGRFVLQRVLVGQASFHGAVVEDGLWGEQELLLELPLSHEPVVGVELR